MGFEEDNTDEESFILTEAIMTNGIIYDKLLLLLVYDTMFR